LGRNKEVAMPAGEHGSAFVSRLLILAAAALGLGLLPVDSPAYLDSRQPVEVRVKDLLGRMTLEEKVGQLNMPCDGRWNPANSR
jgi:hypothetical protein